MKITQIFFLLLFACRLNGQDLSGTWEGSGGTSTPYLKLVIVKSGQNYIGYSYDEGGLGFCKANFIGTFDTSSKKLKGKGTGFIERTFDHGLATYSLNYSAEVGTEYLRGAAWPKSIFAKVLMFGFHSGVFLVKKSNKIDTTDFIRDRIVVTEPMIIPEAEDSVFSEMEKYEKLEDSIVSIKKERPDDTLSTIQVSQREITLKVFDNGITDGDSISILFNDKLIAAKVGVTANVIAIPLELDSNLNKFTITLVAHNLGSIPPNTATVVIEAGEKKYTLSASTDLKKNASIIVIVEKLRRGG